MVAAVMVLADAPTQTGPEFGKASPVGLFVVVLLFIGTCLLVWSMNRHLKRLPKSFGPEPEPESVPNQVPNQVPKQVKVESTTPDEPSG